VTEIWWSRPSSDPVELRALLERDRGYAAYALGDLAPGFREYSRWYVAGRGTAPEALILLFERLDPPALFCFGPGAGVATAIRRASLPARVYFTGLMEHAMAVAGLFHFRTWVPMWRMTISEADFRPAGAGRVRRLRMDDLPALRRLYVYGGGDAFAPYQLEQGVFFGCWDGENLVAVAGTHLVASEPGVAAIGNVFTHPDHRRRGFGAAVTSAVTAELLHRGMTVVLNVAQRNAPAIALYRRLGYRCHCPFVEGIADLNPPQRLSEEISQTGECT